MDLRRRGVQTQIVVAGVVMDDAGANSSAIHAELRGRFPGIVAEAGARLKLLVAVLSVAEEQVAARGEFHDRRADGVSQRKVRGEDDAFPPQLKRKSCTPPGCTPAMVSTCTAPSAKASGSA